MSSTELAQKYGTRSVGKPPNGDSGRGVQVGASLDGTNDRTKRYTFANTVGNLMNGLQEKNEKGEIVVGNLEDVICHNIQFFDEVNDCLIATGHCPFCGRLQRTRLVDEKI